MASDPNEWGVLKWLNDKGIYVFGVADGMIRDGQFSKMKRLKLKRRKFSICGPLIILNLLEVSIGPCLTLIRSYSSTECHGWSFQPSFGFVALKLLGVAGTFTLYIKEGKEPCDTVLGGMIGCSGILSLALTISTMFQSAIWLPISATYLSATMGICALPDLGRKDTKTTIAVCRFLVTAYGIAGGFYIYSGAKTAPIPELVYDVIGPGAALVFIANLICSAKCTILSDRLQIASLFAADSTTNVTTNENHQVSRRSNCGDLEFDSSIHLLHTLRENVGQFTQETSQQHIDRILASLERLRVANERDRAERSDVNLASELHSLLEGQIHGVYRPPYLSRSVRDRLSRNVRRETFSSVQQAHSELEFASSAPRQYSDLASSDKTPSKNWATLLGNTIQNRRSSGLNSVESSGRKPNPEDHSNRRSSGLNSIDSFGRTQRRSTIREPLAKANHSHAAVFAEIEEAENNQGGHQRERPVYYTGLHNKKEAAALSFDKDELSYTASKHLDVKDDAIDILDRLGSDSFDHQSSPFGTKTLPDLILRNNKLDMDEMESNYLRQNMLEWNFGNGGIFERLNDDQMPKVFRTNPLTTLFLEATQHFDCANTLSLDLGTMARFMDRIERKYMDSDVVQYHNSLHATDVLQGIAWVLNLTEVRESLIDPPMSMFAALFGAAIHDVAHPGRNEDFHVKTQSKLSILYSDRSVLEHHHLAVAFSTLQGNPSVDFLRNLDESEKRRFRGIVIEMVLSTDMASHAVNLDGLRELLESGRPMSRALKRDPSTYLENPDDHSDNNLILCSIVHMCDIGNVAKSWDVYRQWIPRIFAEFFAQGDEERSLGWDVARFYDRDECFPCEMQILFIDSYVVDQLKLLGTWCPALTDELASNLEDNKMFLKQSRHVQIDEMWHEEENDQQPQVT